MIIPRDTKLVVTAIGSVANTVVRGTVNVLRPGGDLVRRFIDVTAVNADEASSAADTEVLGNGMIVGGALELTSGGGTTPADVYAMLELRNQDDAGNVVWQHVIMGGHCPGNVKLAYPFFQPPQAHLRVLSPANPAAGADLNYSLPSTLECVHLINASLKLVTDANAGNRIVYLYGTESGDNILWHTAGGSTQGASLTRYWVLDHGASATVADATVGIALKGSQNTCLPIQGKVKTNTAVIQVGDQISAVRLVGMFRWVFD